MLIHFKLLILFLTLINLLDSHPAEADVRRFNWEVKYQYKSPDCYKKLAIVINGRTPGPPIVATQGDTIIVEVKNCLLTENIAIHWHGIRQIGTPWSDGTEAISQCPIMAGDSFTYEFVVDRPGTYMYHAHYGMQREAGLLGSLRVSPPAGVPEPFACNFDRSIILTDWYHKSTYEEATGLSSVPFGWVGDPQSLLIQGKGRFDCANMDARKCNASNPECTPYALTVMPGKTYRLRLGSLTALACLSFQIEGHDMTVVETDGRYVEPFVVKNLFIYSGETYSVLIKTDQNPSTNYWITTNMVSRKSTTPPGQAILNYYPNNPRAFPSRPAPTGPVWHDFGLQMAQSLALKAHKDFNEAPPPKSDRVIVMLNTQNTINGTYHWAINNVSFTLPKTPYLIALKENMLDTFDQTPPPEGYDDVNFDIHSIPSNHNATMSTGIYKLDYNTTVDIILQNANTMTKDNSEMHPWHLHGHDFWVLGYGEGKFDKVNDPNKYNLANPIMKNTAVLYPYGWTALRFRADNPGVWAFHCHIESHFYMGMGVVFAEAVERVGKLPENIMGCGKARLI